MKSLLRKLQRQMSRKKKHNWREIEYFDEKWKDRIKALSFYISNNDEKICDLGCGKSWLKDYISDRIEYFGVDYIQRNSNTIVCDLNKKELPSTKIMEDVIFASGVLEYMEDMPWLVENFSKFSRKTIVSYCTVEDFSDLKQREFLAWKNHYSLFEFINIFLDNGFILTKIDKMNDNTLLCFEKNINTKKVF